TVPDIRLAGPDTKVTAVTLQPKSGLKYHEHYSMIVDSSVSDFDVDAMGAPAPKRLRDGTRTFTFDTMVPEALGQSDASFASAGIVVLGDRAYLGMKQNAPNGFVGVFDVSDPLSLPEIIGGRRAVTGQPTDVDGEELSPLTGGRVIVAGSGLAYVTHGPSNLFLWDAGNEDAPQRKAIVSVTQSTEEGILLRLALKGSFAYTLTYPKGIQVVDLARAMANYKAAQDQGRAQSFVLDAVTSGTGVSQDAIVATIPAVNQSGGNAHLVDLKAGDFIYGNNSQPLVLGAGAVPFYVADPIGGRTLFNAAVVENPNFGRLTFGRALAIGTLGTKRVAVVVGNGTGLDPEGSSIDGPYTMAVLDMTNPAAPAMIGSMRLTKSPTDVVLRDRKAVIAAEGVGIIVDLTDPARPRRTGEVPNVGHYIALSELNVLYSTLPDGGGSALNVGVYVPMAVIEPVTPILVRVKEVAVAAATSGRISTNTVSDAAQQFETIRKTDIVQKVVPFVSGAQSGTLRIVQKDATYVDITTNFNSGRATTTLPPNQPIGTTALEGVLTVPTSYGTLVSPIRKIKVRWAELVVDSNNDAKVNDDDRAVKEKNKRAWGFWEADCHFTKWKAEPETEDYKALEDFATIRVSVSNQAKNFIDLGGSFQLRLVDEHPIVAQRKECDDDHTFPTSGLRFSVVEKASPGEQNSYLSSSSELQSQYALGAKTPNCDPSLEHWEGDCVSSGAGLLTLPALGTGDHEFLFRCLNCPADVNAPGEVKYLQLLWKPNEGAAAEVIDQAKVDIRPLPQWVVMQNARSVRGDGGMEFRPLPHDQWRYSTHAAGDDTQWPYELPQGARNVTVIVHGYNVPHYDALQTFFPTYVKRLYWTGVPVLRRQSPVAASDAADDAQGCAPECAAVTAISWPSNQGGQAGGSLEEKVNRLRGATRMARAGMEFPEDEFHALQAGIPLAFYLQYVNQQRAGRTINVIAHSLGNIVVNSALSQDAMAGNFINSYVMNDAAMPGEVFNYANPGYAEELRGHAETYGFSTDPARIDQPWRDDWTYGDISAAQLWVSNVRGMENVDGLSVGTFDPHTMYEARWRMSAARTLPIVTTLNQSNRYTRGDWRGFFELNTSRVRNPIGNTWSSADKILSLAWINMQRTLKPNPGSGLGWKALGGILGVTEMLTRRVGLGTRVSDGISIQRWALRDYTDQRQWLVHRELNGDWNLKRQYAELAHWFPAVSKSAGAGSLTAARGTITNCEFTRYSAGKPFVHTHSYMKMSTYPEVLDAWTNVKRLFEGGSCQ
ncbi:MAG: hypothetical protein JWO56_2036, partial [Acidobacteria bacterium]|nr:hypothetical protein [Acidobacteriota bacterium]